ncbi:hypothetical protein Ab1vBOLIVR5_gp10 [Agrobacterium phage OLIVR5]|uniref:Uncharacterized protein n=1 Tax=Agrobacterium phage OLIVR5 TaxID=2723773 RepID=A0A858MSU0_9CAUD|nr:hypothetical protein KNU99_gp010 [Agrobacterium phage OLIVR5]QIW87658.1 hypothetical protein Ab1vBOLIVR5_gp10 [Agrobacterium phage OLIVR5]QIW87917.1 hypothetical protein Ab1vBOLIVR6_gp10 [Agrobacterium phage OLIVR6]
MYKLVIANWYAIEGRIFETYTDESLEGLLRKYPWKVLRGNVYDIRNDYDKVPVDIEFCKMRARRIIDEKTLEWIKERHKGCKFRVDPIPGTKKRRYRHYRHPRTTQEIRADNANPEFARRKHLVTSWSDLVRNDLQYGRPASWKNSKKKRQWM